MDSLGIVFDSFSDFLLNIANGFSQLVLYLFQEGEFPKAVFADCDVPQPAVSEVFCDCSDVFANDVSVPLQVQASVPELPPRKASGPIPVHCDPELDEICPIPELVGRLQTSVIPGLGGEDLSQNPPRKQRRGLRRRLAEFFSRRSRKTGKSTSSRSLFLPPHSERKHLERLVAESESGAFSDTSVLDSLEIVIPSFTSYTDRGQSDDLTSSMTRWESWESVDLEVLYPPTQAGRGKGRGVFGRRVRSLFRRGKAED